MTVAAIDLGSSAIRVAIARDGVVRTVSTPDGTDETPAVVSFAPGAVQVGRQALGAAVTSPRATVRGVKRWLGVLGDDAVFARLRSESGLDAQRRGDGVAFALDGARKSAVSVAAILCKHALALAEREVGQSPTGVVFAHPLPDPRDCEEALLSLAGELGIAAVSTVAEPVAAAAGACPDSPERTVWIVDVGASHTSIAAVLLRAGTEPEPLYAIGEPIGGDDVDDAIAARLVGARLEGLDAGLREMLRQQCEQMKIDLSSAPTMRCTAPPHLVPILGLDPRWTLDIAGLTDAGAPLLRAVEECCERARSAARLGADAELYVVGGMTRLAPVRARIEQGFGTRARAIRAPGVLALGAARLSLRAPPTRTPDRMQARVSWRAPRLATPAPAGFTQDASTERDATGSAPPRGQAAPASNAAPAASAPPTGSAPPAGAVDAPPRDERLPPSQPAQPVTRPASASVLGLNEGRIRNPPTPAELLAMPLARPIRQADLDPIALPLLLLLTSNARRSGTLTLCMDGAPPLDIPFLSGRAFLAATESRALVDAFANFTGTFRFVVGEPENSGRRLEQRMAPLVVEGLRRLMRPFDPSAMAQALGERMDRAPALRPVQQQAAARLGLTDVERRMVSFAFNGRTSARSAVELGGARHTTLALLLLLTLYDLVEWRAASTTTQPSLRIQLDERARQMEAANYFQVLGVHWSALEDEISAAHKKLQDELAPGTPVFDVAPDACRRMLTRVDEAYACLHDAQRRGAYRRHAYPEMDFEAAEDLVERKRRAVSLRDDGKRELKRLDRTRQEISRSKSKPKTLG